MKLRQRRLKIRAGLISSALFFGVAPLPAQNSGAGTTIFEFLNIPYDARSVAVSGATVALPNDLYGILDNPAALGFITTSQALVGYRPIGNGVYGVPAAYALPKGEKGVFAVSLAGLTTGNMDATDIGPDGAPVPSGTARADYLAGTFAWAKKMNEYLAAAVTAKGLYNYLGSSNDHYSADGFAVDGGVQCRFLNSRLIYGLVIRNIGLLRSGYTTNDDHYSLPAAIEIGISYVPRYIDGLRIAFDMNKKKGDYLTFTPAAELEILKNQMVVRGGFGFSYQDLLYAKDFLAGDADPNYIKSNRTTLCLGVGFMTAIMQRKVSLDAAMEFFDGQSLPVLAISMLSNI
jgi:hypothetical protein